MSVLNAVLMPASPYLAISAMAHGAFRDGETNTAIAERVREGNKMNAFGATVARIFTRAATVVVAGGLLAPAPVLAQGYPYVDCNNPYYYQYCQAYNAWYNQYYAPYSYGYADPYYGYGVPVGVGVGFGFFHHGFHRGFNGGFHGGGFHGGGHGGRSGHR